MGKNPVIMESHNSCNRTLKTPTLHAIDNEAIKWSKMSQRKKGRSCETLKRTLLKEASLVGITSLDEVEKLAEDRKTWQTTM